MKIVAILMVSLTYLAVCRSDVAILKVNDTANETSSIKEVPKMVSKTAMDSEVKSQNNRTETPLVEETELDYNDNQTETLMNEETEKTCVNVTLDAICMKLDTSIGKNLAPNEVGMKEREVMIRFFGGPNINETEKRSLNESIFFSENGNQSLICIVPPEEAGILYIPPHFKCEACRPYTFAEMVGIGFLTTLVLMGVLAIIVCIVKKCDADLSKQPKHQVLISGDTRNASTKMR